MMTRDRTSFVSNPAGDTVNATIALLWTATHVMALGAWTHFGPVDALANLIACYGLFVWLDCVFCRHFGSAERGPWGPALALRALPGVLWRMARAAINRRLAEIGRVHNGRMGDGE